MRMAFAPWLLLAVGSTSLARPGEPSVAAAADRHLERGLAHYQAKRWAQAADEFEAGSVLNPRPELLFAAAQAYRMDGRCQRAISDYERFIATRPSPQRHAAAQRNMDRCRRTLAANQASDSPPELAVPPAADAPSLALVDAAAP